MNYFRYAIRHALAQPGFSAIVILTTALTIGAAAAVFSLFDAALLRPFPYAASDRLVRLETFNPKDKGSERNVSLFDFEDYRSRNRTLQGMAAYMTWSNPLVGQGPSLSVRMTFASAGLFDVLGVKPQLGRVFTPAEDVQGGPVLKMVIGDRLWKSLFGGRADALGKTIQLRGETYEVIGVMPAGFAFPDRSEVWVPIMARYSAYKDDWWKRRDARIHRVIARLRDGVSVEQASADAAAIATVLRSEHPEQSLDAHGRVISLRDAEVSEVRPYVQLVAGAAILLLILGCSNVANLLLARSVARGREVALKLALGSGVWPLIWQLLAEAAVLSLAGAALGVGLAYLGVKGFLALLPVNVPEWMRLEMDYRVLAFAAASAVVTAMVAMLLPAAQQIRANVSDVLKQGARGSTEGRGFTAWARRGLVAGEIALSLMLLASAGLMVRSFQKAMSIESGLRPERLLVVESGRFVPNVTKETAVRAYSVEYRKVQLALEQIPGVTRASGGHTVPFMRSDEQRPAQELYTLRRSTRDQAFRLAFRGADVMPGYFATLGVPIVAGRDFTENDSLDAPPVIIISQRLAETLFPGESAVGQKIRFGINQEYDPWSTVIGVAGNMRFNAGERDPGHEAYWSYRQYPGPGIYFVLRTAADPASILPEIKHAIQRTNPEISVDRMVEMQSLMTESIWRRRLWGAILAVFAALALLLAMVGLYGMMSYSVAQQRKEIGIRLAIGAPRSSILQWVLRGGMALTLAGVTFGLGGAVAAGALWGDLLFGISGRDLTTFGLVTAILSGTAFITCLIPAIRATRVDPMIALRQE